MRTRFLLALLFSALPLCTFAAAGYERRGNSVTLPVPGGWAKIEWVTTGAFRCCRGWGWPAGCPDLADREPVAFTDHGELGSVELRSRGLAVRIEKATGRITIATAEGVALLEEAGIARSGSSSVAVRFRISPSEKFQGLGMRDGPVFLHAARVTTRWPFLLSNRGYGIYFPAPGEWEFDLGASASGMLEARAQDGKRLEYFFYQGGSPKEVFEEHFAASSQVERLNAHDIRVAPPSDWPAEASPIGSFGPPCWDTLRATVRALINGSLSAALLPAWDLTPWRNAPAGLHRRAAQLAVFLPLLGDSTLPQMRPQHPALDTASAALRARLTPFLLTYTLEAHDRGFPVIHPLAMQFPDDAQGASLEDEFFFGDEILVAPALDTTGRRRVYLPMGRWTDLWSHATYKGKQTIEIEVPEHAPALLVKNGSLIPLAAERAGEPMELHYFPALGGEFFLAEDGLWQPTQLHASPAGDYYRLETESKKDRDYEWIVHHLAKPSKVTEGDEVYLEVGDRTMLANGCWYYDAAQRNLHVRQQARAGADQVINIAF
jgi:alpha-glucosidase (family GH31 glycosyl hydrolase)